MSLPTPAEQLAEPRLPPQIVGLKWNPPNLVANNGSTVNISDGTIGSNFDVQDGSTVNILGGIFGDFFEVQDGGTVNISGGSFGDSFDARSGSSINLFGSEFFLNDTLIDTLTLGEPLTIFDRGEDVVLSGVFADGTRFDFELNSSTVFSNTGDSFDPNSTLTITRVAAVPEPGCGLTCLLYTSPSPRDGLLSRMPSSA